jgi:hypothetical protein
LELFGATKFGERKEERDGKDKLSEKRLVQIDGI